MNTLKVKILGLATIILCSAIALTAWHNLRTQQAIINEVAAQNGKILGDTIFNIIVANMSSGQNAEVVRIFEQISREPAIETIRIFDENGRIVMSGRPEEVGDLIPAAELLSFRSGKAEAPAGSLSTSTDYHCTMVPINNAPQCYGCHSPQQELLGILEVHYTLNNLLALQATGRGATLASSAGALILLIFALTGFVLYYVDIPIHRLISAMHKVEDGHFEEVKIDIGSSREMSLLAGQFNLMVERLRDLMQETVRHERELAVAQENLANHEEINRLNVSMEERMREIEFLNIALEERIEEIEEANYKIADLASDLDGKNKNLAQAVTRLSALYKMGLALNSTMDIDKLFDLLLRKTVETLNAKIGYILLLDRDNWGLKLAAGIGLPSGTDRRRRIPLRAGGVSHWVVEHQEPLLIKNIEEAREFNRISYLGYARETLICAPLLTKEGIIGTLTIANRRDAAPFTADDLELLSIIAAQASIAIRNARLYDEQQSTYLSTVQALVSTIEANDAYTRGHSERVTRYSLILARHLGLEAAAIKRLEQAAILHDIGKIGIDTAILNKEEILSLDDMETLRQHPSIGVRILEPIDFLRDVGKIIEQHHERYNGTGYPKALAGDGILPEARILAIADAYDAMTSDRPYRKALSREVALQEIRDHAGTQFDPIVVQAFLAVHGEFDERDCERLAG